MSETPPNSVHPLTLAEWRAWLAENHTRAEGVWLITYKKAAGKPRIEYEASVEEALCFGWIDSKANTVDAERSMLWFAPRRPGTGWAKSNKERVARLIAEDRMTPAGLAKIEAAQADGSWNLLDSVEALEIPPDLTGALAAVPNAAANFDAFPPGARRIILQWIVQAKTPATRAKRIEDTARLAGENIRAYPRPK